MLFPLPDPCADRAEQCAVPWSEMRSRGVLFLKRRNHKPSPRTSCHPAGNGPRYLFFRSDRYDDLQLIHGFSALIPLEVNLSIVINAHLKPVGQRIYNGCTNAVQTAGYLVPSAAELSACVQHRKDNLNGRKARLMIDADRNTTAVVDDGDGVVRVNRNVNIFCSILPVPRLPSCRQSHRQMVKSPCGGTADIHTWSFSNGL